MLVGLFDERIGCWRQLTARNLGCPILRVLCKGGIDYSQPETRAEGSWFPTLAAQELRQGWGTHFSGKERMSHPPTT
jgi:hypothetical protein